MAEQKNVLIVEDETAFLDAVSCWLKMDPSFNVLTASNGLEAIKALLAGPVDIVVTDLQMPILDGIELIAYLSVEFPVLPVIIMTCWPPSLVKDRMSKKGPLQYTLLGKPFSLDVLTEKIHEVFQAEANGCISGITLSSLIQILAMEGKTCRIRVLSQEKEGTLVFSKGKMIHAEVDGIQGEEAAYRIINLERPIIEIEEALLCPKTITASVSQLLIESHRRKDEGLI